MDDNNEAGSFCNHFLSGIFFLNETKRNKNQLIRASATLNTASVRIGSNRISNIISKWSENTPIKFNLNLFPSFSPFTLSLHSRFHYRFISIYYWFTPLSCLLFTTRLVSLKLSVDWFCFISFFPCLSSSSSSGIVFCVKKSFKFDSVV